LKPIIIKSLLPIIVALILLLVPEPIGLQTGAWNYFILFVVVIIGLIAEPIPSAAIGLIGISIAALIFTRSMSDEEAIKWALTGFANPTVWLIFTAFMFALGYQKSGLGKRIALILVKYFGKNTLGLGYAIAFSDLILAPLMPSNTARSGGTIYPIISRIPSLYHPNLKNNERQIGSYIYWVALSSACVTSSMFLTSLAPNLLAADIVNKTIGIEISWISWFIYFLPVGFILILIVPVFIYVIYPPKLKKCPEIKIWATDELQKLGGLTKQELKMAGLAIIALLLWIFGKGIINPTTAAIIVLCMMMLTNTISWEDIISNKSAWNVLVWFATLVTLAGGLSKTGLTTWIGKYVSTLLPLNSPMIVLVILIVSFYFLHYFFASVTSHVTALLPLFLITGKSIPGLNMFVFSYLLVYSLGIVGILTPYGTGPSPIYYESKIISKNHFWSLGFVCGILFLIILLCIGIPFLFYINVS
jgi:L-tartrate/succinate antiporter